VQQREHDDRDQEQDDDGLPRAADEIGRHRLTW
jgi:hypothetical protein